MSALFGMYNRLLVAQMKLLDPGLKSWGIVFETVRGGFHTQLLMYPKEQYQFVNDWSSSTAL